MLSERNRHPSATQPLTASCPAGATFSGHSPRKSLATFRRKSRFWWKRRAGVTRAGWQWSWQGWSERLVGQGTTDIDEIIADHGEPDPAFHPRRSFIATAI